MSSADRLVDYGAYPDPKRWYFTLQDVTNTLTLVAPGTGVEGAIYAALQALTGNLLEREWHREDGAMMKIDRCQLGVIDRYCLSVLSAVTPSCHFDTESWPVRRSLKSPDGPVPTKTGRPDWTELENPECDGKTCRSARHV